MDARKLQRLNKAGESRTFERKIECNAFQGNRKANAELIKDICAMANNGPRESYIVVGISNDGREFRSVRNRNLTDDNLQSLIKNSITPTPATNLKSLRVLRNGKTYDLGVITIGKNKRQAFRLATDLIDYKQNYAFRRNEVWIRRRGTCDLATPEEIVRLQAGEDLEDPTGALTNSVFARMSVTQRKDAILDAIAQASSDFALYPEDQVALMNVSEQAMVLRSIYHEKFPLGSHSRLVITYLFEWGFEHGLVLFSPEKHPGKMFDPHPFGKNDGELSIVSKESWGSFCLAEVAGSGEKKRHVHPGMTSPALQKTLKNGPPLQVPIFVLAGIKDVHSLVRRVNKMVEFANSPEVAPTLIAARAAINETLARVVTERKAFVQIQHEERFRYKGKPSALYAGQAVDSRRFGKDVIVGVVRDPRYRQAAKYVLACSRLPLGATLPPDRILGETLGEKSEHADGYLHNAALRNAIARAR